MVEIGSRLSKLVSLLDEVSASEMRSSLPALVNAGEVRFYVRVPAGKVVYIDGIPPLQTTISDVRDAGSRSLSPYERGQARDAKRAGTPVIRYPVVVPGAAYLGLAPKDAGLLLALERMDVYWFPCAVQFSPLSGTDAKPLTRVVPQRSPCCLRPADGQPERGPWIGHDTGHALAIELRDVLVEQGALRNPTGSVEDPLKLQSTAPGVYVLYRVSARLNDPEKGITLSQTAVVDSVKYEAAVCDVAGWLFNGEVLRQARKLINTHHSETQGVEAIAKLKLDVLDEDEAALHATHRWISSRIALLIHAARFWRELVRKEGRVWASMDAEEKLVLASRLGHSLRGWGFTTVGEWRAAFLVAAYPDDLRSITKAVQSSLQIRA